MKEVFVSHSLDLIKKYYPDYSSVKLEQLEYGLLGLYMVISKSIVIFAIAFILGIFKELLIFTIIYNILRAPSFGIHASKSFTCLISSMTVFIGMAYLSKSLIIPINIIIILGIIGTLLIYKNSPADTAKKPIVSLKRRRIYKILSTFISINYVIISLIINDNFLSNALILSIILQCIIISPITYKILGEPYDNYKSYQS